MADDLNTEIKIGADASGVEAGVGRAKRSLASLGDAAKKAGKEGGEGIGSIGAGGDKAAEKVERATRNMQNSIQRQIAVMQAGSKESREYWEALASQRGLDANALRPYLDQLQRVTEETNKAKEATDGLMDQAKGLGVVLGTAIAGLMAGFTLDKFIQETIGAQQEQAQLAAVLKSTGEAARFSQKQLNDMADSLSASSVFSGGDINQAQTRLLAYTGIVGKEFPRAMQNVIDMASRMGMSVTSSAETIGRALDVPSEGLTALTRQGFKFSEAQKQLVESLEATGRTGEAQAIIMDALESSYGGAAEAAAGTLGGALAQLQNQIDDLMTGGDGSINGMTAIVKTASGVVGDFAVILDAATESMSGMENGTGALSTVQESLATFFETIAVLANETIYVLRQTGDTLGGLAAGYKAFFSFDFDAVRAIGKDMKENGEQARREIDATTARIISARKEAALYSSYATRNASAATDPRRIDLGGTTTRTTSGGVSSGTAKAVKETISEYDKLIKKLSDELPKAAAEAEAAQNGYNKAQTEFVALANGPAWAKFTNNQRANVAALFATKITSESAADATKALNKANEDAAKSREKYLTSLDAGLDKIKADAAAQIDATARMGLSKDAIAALDAAKLEMLATDLELQAVKALDRNLDQQTYDALKQQAAAYRELGIAKKGGAAKEAALDLEKANAEAAKKAQEDWERASEQINSTLTDALMRGFESGKDFAKNLRDTVVNMFKTLVLRPIISAVVNPVAGAVTNALGLGGGQSGGGGIAGGIQTASNLNSLYGAGSQALFGGAAGASAASLGYANVVGMAGGDAIGALATANGMWAGVATGAQAAAQSAIAANLALEAGTATALASGTTAAAAGGTAAAGAGGISGTLAAIPGWGWALAGVAVLGSIFGKDDSGTYHTGGAGSYSAAGGASTGAKVLDQGLTFGVRYKDYNKQAEGAAVGISQSIVGMLDATAKSFGNKAGYFAATAFADDSSKDGAWGSLIIKRLDDTVTNWADTQTSKWAPKVFSDGEAGQKEYSAALAMSVRDALVGAVEGVDWAQSLLTGLGDAPTLEGLQGVVATINAAQAAFDALGKNIVGFGALTDGAISQLIKAAGSIDGLISAASTYYENFYTDAEKTANATRDVAAALADVGLQMPTTRDEFRALVEAQMALGDSGTGAVAALLGVSGAFASVTAASETAAEAAARLAADAAARLADEQNKAAEAAEAAARRAQEVARERYDIETELYNLLGDTTKLRERELDALDASNRALKEYIYSLQDAFAAVDSAFGTVQRSISAAKAALQKDFDAGQKQRQQAQSDAQATSGLIDGISKAIANALSAQTIESQQFDNMRRAQAQAQLDGFLASLGAGDSATDLQGLDRTLGTLGKDSRAGFGTFEDYAFDRGVTAGKLAELGQLADAQKTVAEQTLEQITAGNEADIAAYEAQQSALDATLAQAQSMYDAIKGVDNSVLSVAAAMQQFSETLINLDAIKAQRANALRQSGASPEFIVTGQYRDFMGNLVDIYNGQSQEFFNALGKSGTAAVSSLQELKDRLDNLGNAGVWEEFASGLRASEKVYDGVSYTTVVDKNGGQVLTGGNFNPDLSAAEKLASEQRWLANNFVPQYEQGTPYVPNDGLAFLHKGERVIPAQYNTPGSLLQNGGASNAEIAAALRAMAARLDAIEANTRAAAGHTAATHRQLVRIAPNDIVQTEVAA